MACIEGKGTGNILSAMLGVNRVEAKLGSNLPLAQQHSLGQSAVDILLNHHR